MIQESRVSRRRHEGYGGPRESEFRGQELEDGRGSESAGVQPSGRFKMS